MRTRLNFLTVSRAACAALLLVLSSVLPAAAVVDSRPSNALTLQDTPVTVRTCAASVPCGVSSFICYNPNGSAAYVQLFDLSTTVTPGSTVPTAVISMEASRAVAGTVGWRFYSAVQAIATTTPTGATPASTAVVCTFGVQ